MTDSEHDDEFEAYLKRRVPIHQRLKPLERLEPPPELDRMVIGEARQAIKGVAPVRVYRAPRWALPVGLAATLLIAFSIMLQLGMRTAKQQDAPAAANSSVATSSDATQRGVPPAAQALQDSAPQAQGSLAQAPSVPVPKAVHAIKTAPWAPLQRLAKSQPAEASTGAPGTGATDDMSRDNPRSRAAEQELAASRQRTSEASEIAEAKVSGQSVASATAAPSSGGVPALAAAPLTSSGGASAPAATHAAGPVASAADKPAAHPLQAPVVYEEIVVAAARRQPMHAPVAVEAGADRQEHPDPGVWLDHIEKLRSAGLTTQADAELKRFRDAYPQYPVPPGAPPADGRAQ